MGGGSEEHYVIVTKGKQPQDPERNKTAGNPEGNENDDSGGGGGGDLNSSGTGSNDEFVLVNDPKASNLAATTLMESTIIPREELEALTLQSSSTQEKNKPLQSAAAAAAASMTKTKTMSSPSPSSAPDSASAPPALMASILAKESVIVVNHEDAKWREADGQGEEEDDDDDEEEEVRQGTPTQAFLMVSRDGETEGIDSMEPTDAFEVDRVDANSQGEATVPEEMLQSTHRGLSNKFGENNCFLNGVLQVLWHNKTFRKCLLSVQHHVCQAPGGQCVYCQLKNLFMEYQFSDSAQIPTTAVRKTLAIIYKPEHKFQLNAMDDAAECLEAILQRVHNDLVSEQRKAQGKESGKPVELSDSTSKKEITCNPACIAHNVFGMNVLEQSVCGCGSTTEPLCYSTFVQYFSVDELLEMAQSMTKPLPDGWEKRITPTGQTYFVNHRTKKSTWQAPPGCDIGDSPGYSFSFLLHTVSINNLQVCPNEACKKRNPIYRTLLNIPKAVSIGLTWSSDQVKMGQIAEFMKLIQPYIDLKSTFNATAIEIDPSHLMVLRGLVCYYGHHYIAFNYSVSFQTWLMFDDANVVEVGPTFDSVIQKCIRSTYQPSLLFYETSA